MKNKPKVEVRYRGRTQERLMVYMADDVHEWFPPTLLRALKQIGVPKAEEVAGAIEEHIQISWQESRERKGDWVVSGYEPYDAMMEGRSDEDVCETEVPWPHKVFWRIKGRTEVSPEEVG